MEAPIGRTGGTSMTLFKWAVRGFAVTSLVVALPASFTSPEIAQHANPTGRIKHRAAARTLPQSIEGQSAACDDPRRRSACRSAAVEPRSHETRHARTRGHSAPAGRRFRAAGLLGRDEIAAGAPTTSRPPRMLPTTSQILQSATAGRPAPGTASSSARSTWPRSSRTLRSAPTASCASCARRPTFAGRCMTT